MARHIAPLLPLLFFVSAAFGQPGRDLIVEEMTSEQRVALIVGNGDYKDSPLKNPVRLDLNNRKFKRKGLYPKRSDRKAGDNPRRPWPRVIRIRRSSLD